MKNVKKEHRTVVLPDYQGLGIGHKISTFVASIYKEKGYRFISTSNTRAFFISRSKDPRWRITRKGRTGQSKGVLKGTQSNNKITYSYEYNG